MNFFIISFCLDLTHFYNRSKYLKDPYEKEYRLRSFFYLDSPVLSWVCLCWCLSRNIIWPQSKCLLLLKTQNFFIAWKEDKMLKQIGTKCGKWNDIGCFHELPLKKKACAKRSHLTWRQTQTCISNTEKKLGKKIIIFRLMTKLCYGEWGNYQEMNREKWKDVKWAVVGGWTIFDIYFN